MFHFQPFTYRMKDSSSMATSCWYSIHVKFRQYKSPYVVNEYLQRKEEEAVRILLKHLRRRRYKDAFEALSRESGVQLEGPLQSRLWNALVENGDYVLSEKIMEEALNGYYSYIILL